MSAIQLLKPFRDTETGNEFAKNFIKGFAVPSFGALSKTEVDNLVFGLLIEAGAINRKAQVYEIARDLKVTPAKARNLLFQWQMRQMAARDLRSEIIETLTSVRFTKDHDYLSFGIESPVVQEELRSRLKHIGIYADASFAKEILRLSPEHFADFLEDFVSKEQKEKLEKSLFKEGVTKDKSFKGVALRAVRGAIAKVAGNASGELAELLGNVINDLISGDGDVANGLISGDRDVAASAAQ